MIHTTHVANMVSIKDKKILIVRKGDFWILPGGKRNRGETVWGCIVREFSEELPGVRILGNSAYFGMFPGKSPNGKNIKVFCILGDIQGDISPAAEISDACWASKEELFAYYKNSLSEVTQRIVAKLCCKGFI